MGSQPTLLDVLQAEFCPPLDSSLVAAIAADYISDCSAPANTASEGLQTVRSVLTGLASQAEKELFDEDALSDRVSRVRISPQSATDDTSSSHDFFSTDYSTSQTGTSSASDPSSPQSFTPLAFLKAAFPHLPVGKLRSVLSEHGQADDIDMEAVVESVLTKEYVRDLEERGFDDSGLSEDPEEQWLTVQSKKKQAGSGVKVKKKTKKGTTYALVDVRQQQHVRAASQDSRMSGSDPWTQVSSVASYLSTLLPRYSASHFQSIFHSPTHPTPAAALRAALTSLCKPRSSSADDLSPEEANVLIGLLDILRASDMYDTLNAEERSRLVSDAKLALRATEDQPDSAIDLVWLLRDLESDYASGDHTWGVYHSPAPPQSPSISKPGLRGTLKLPTGPPPIQPPPRSPMSATPKSPKPNPNAWQTVPPRSPAFTTSSHASFIPAYAPAGKRKIRGSGNAVGKGGKGDVGELASTSTSHRGRMLDLRERRREALREAGRAWQKANAKTHGGEVAFFYAERARELQQQAKDEQLEATREMVLAKRQSSAKQDTIDLHGATASEAIQIARDILALEGASGGKPLRIITGRGNHSINGVSIIGPAVKAALVGDGWYVGSYDGGLVVRGRV